MPLSWNLMLFSWLDWVYGFGGGRSLLLSCHGKNTNCQHDLWLLSVNLIVWLRWFVRFLYCELTPIFQRLDLPKWQLCVSEALLLEPSQSDPALVVTSFSLLTPSFACKDPHNYFGPTWHNSGYLPILRSADERPQSTCNLTALCHVT